VPTQKRARQKAARRKKRAAQVRRIKTRRRMRSGTFLAAGAAVVIVLVLLSTGAFSGSSKPPKKNTTPQAKANALAVAAGCKSSPTARANTLTWSSPPAMTIDTTKTYTATVKTTAGTFAISLDAAAAPDAVNNFVFLSKKGFYNCNTFHRVVPGFVDQTGDPTGTGSGGPGYEFANENIPTAYATGDVAMANSGGTDSNESQFFIVVPGGATTLDNDLKSGDKYTLFGSVTSGMKAVEKINSEGGTTSTGKPKVVQRILTVKIHES
jgi:cyclophilin family peptidyl-prolyl cis-trans isomerase